MGVSNNRWRKLRITYLNIVEVTEAVVVETDVEVEVRLTRRVGD